MVLIYNLQMISYSQIKNKIAEKGIKDLTVDKVEKLKRIDFRIPANRQFLTKNFRELDKMIDKPRKFCNPQLPKNLGYYQPGLFQQDDQQIKKNQMNKQNEQNKDKDRQKSNKKSGKDQKDSKGNKKQNKSKEGEGQKIWINGNLIDCILDQSRRIQPYIVGDFNSNPNQTSSINDYQRVNFSDMALNSIVFNRECPQPKVKIDGQIVFQFQNPYSNRIKNDDFVYTCYKSTSFLLVIQVLPGHILQMTKDGKCPLFYSNNQCIMARSFQQKLNPPCVINCIALCPRWRLPSRNLTIIVKKNSKNNEQQSKNGQQSGMRRPIDPKYDYLQDSRSSSISSSLWH